VVGDASPLGFTSLGVAEQPGYSLAPWTAANAGASYRWRNYRFNLNVDNLTDARFWWQTSGRLGTQPYPALAVRLSTTIHI
jgi:outer membrane receptor protein involved in Fe transport